MIHRMARNIAKRDIIANSEKISFKDEEQIANWAREAINMLQLGGVLKGNDGYFYPQEGITRAEIATMLSTYLLMDYQTGEVEYFNEHLPELEAEIEANEKYIESLPKPEEGSFTLPDSSPSDTASLSGFQSKGGFQFLDGDILYNPEAGYGLGHIGMICGDRIFEIMPSTEYSNNINPRLVPLEGDSPMRWSEVEFRYDWGNTYLLRRIPAYNNGNQNCRDISVNAAWYAKTYYINGAGRNVTYDVIASTNNTSRANCASIVYRSYKYGASFNYKLSYLSQGMTYYYYPDANVITPANIFNNRVANGFSAIKKF